MAATNLRLHVRYLLIVLPTCASAQQMVTGRVHKKDSPDVMGAVTVENITRHEFDQTDMGGNFRIHAEVGDSLVFSYTEYKSDTVWITKDKVGLKLDVYLVPSSVTQLQSITVGGFNRYQLDSLQRRSDYNSYYHDHQPTSMLAKTTPESGFGMTFSPITYFSKKATQHRALGKRLQKDEEGFYIEYRFNRDYVSKLTGLKGDSLNQFMERYRPTYKWCRAATDQDVLLYINDRYRSFMKRR
jgi:hypothetical protein